ncbi:MAG: flagellar type III secretion system pore protein FliP [Pacificimonas sp.]
MTARRFNFLTLLAGTLFLILVGFPAEAQSINLDLGGGEGETVSGRVIQLVLMITILSLAPGILMTITSFTRFIVVLSLLRTGLGTQGAPPNAVLVSLALFLTFFVMGPTFEQAWEQGVDPLTKGEITEEVAFERASTPFQSFMLTHVRQDDLELFIDLSGREIETAEDTPMTVLAPAFMVSELRRAFEIGFLLFLPFLIIDLVVSAILMAMGMMMLPPVTISLPFKLIFFVLVDGWHLVAGSLVKSFTG